MPTASCSIRAATPPSTCPGILPFPINITIATGINDSGQIVGGYHTGGFRIHGFLFDQGSYTTLDVPGATLTLTYGINGGGHGFLATRMR
jgi:probable HAF family extracellular repeat protein